MVLSERVESLYEVTSGPVVVMTLNIPAAPVFLSIRNPVSFEELSAHVSCQVAAITCWSENGERAPYESTVNSKNWNALDLS
jgi:hypothetical protein